jgi:hypothetical protein
MWCDSQHMTHIIQRSPYTGLDGTCEFQEMEAPRISRQSTHKGGKLDSTVHREIHLVLTGVRGTVNHSAMVRPEGLYQ